jgi:hypothetical protein
MIDAARSATSWRILGWTRGFKQDRVLWSHVRHHLPAASSISYMIQDSCDVHLIQADHGGAVRASDRGLETKSVHQRFSLSPSGRFSRPALNLVGPLFLPRTYRRNLERAQR